MHIRISNNRDNDVLAYDMPTKYFNQSVLSPGAYRYVTEKTNNYWDKDMSFTINIVRTYEESDIFGYPKH